MCKFLHAIEEKLNPLRHFSDRLLSPVAFLAMRLVVAHAFFTSGWLKFGYVLNNQLDTLYFLFEDYHIPLLSVKVAAWMGMAGELGLSTLLAFGLFARFGALGLIVMSAVIYNTDGNAHAIYWAAMCAVIATNGAGKFSLDTLVWRKKPE